MVPKKAPTMEYGTGGSDDLRLRCLWNHQLSRPRDILHALQPRPGSTSFETTIPDPCSTWTASSEKFGARGSIIVLTIRYDDLQQIETCKRVHIWLNKRGACLVYREANYSPSRRHIGI
ncbi:hypothetical protein V3481_013547 [Fusarium oxysporum f. sp. vasinfectum]